MVFPFFQGVYLAEHAPFSLGCRKTGAEWKAPGCSDSPLPPSDAWFSLFALPVTTQVLCVFSQQAPHGRGTHSLTTVWAHRWLCCNLSHENESFLTMRQQVQMSSFTLSLNFFFNPHLRTFLFSLLLATEGESETLMWERIIDWLPPVHARTRGIGTWTENHTSRLGVTHTWAGTGDWTCTLGTYPD